MFRHSSALHVGVTCSSITPVKVLTLIMYFLFVLEMKAGRGGLKVE